jgi:septal ring factor EnvC (AmiA/AmiB activator)
MTPKNPLRLQIRALFPAVLAGLLHLFVAAVVPANAVESNGSIPPGPTRTDAYRQEAEEIRREIKIREKALDSVAREETGIVAELDRVEQQIQRLKRRTRQLDAALKEINRQLSSAAAASADLESRIRANESYLARRLVAWYKLNRVGQIHLLATADTIAAFLQRKHALERILAHDDQVRRKLLDDQNELRQLQEALTARRGEKQQKVSEQQQQLDLLTQKVKKRARLLAKVRARKDLQMSRLKELELSAKELDRKFASFNRRLAPAAPGAVEISKPFSDYKGLLKKPVEGNIINLFGPYRNTQFNVTNFRSGIDIKTDKGEPVRAVYTGNILYANWFRGYGNMMIIDHGANYYTVYAHVEEMFKFTGDRVQTGDVIATVGDTGSTSGARLYFEIRHHGRPVDPVEWLK